MRIQVKALLPEAKGPLCFCSWKEALRIYKAGVPNPGPWTGTYQWPVGARSHSGRWAAGESGSFVYIYGRYSSLMGFPVSTVKRICLPRQETWTGSIPGSGRSCRVGNGDLLQYFLPGKFPGQQSLAGSIPWVAESQTWLNNWTLLMAHITS